MQSQHSPNAMKAGIVVSAYNLNQTGSFLSQTYAVGIQAPFTRRMSKLAMCHTSFTEDAMNRIALCIVPLCVAMGGLSENLPISVVIQR